MQYTTGSNEEIEKEIQKKLILKNIKFWDTVDSLLSNIDTKKDLEIKLKDGIKVEIRRNASYDFRKKLLGVIAEEKVTLIKIEGNNSLKGNIEKMVNDIITDIDLCPCPVQSQNLVEKNMYKSCIIISDSYLVFYDCKGIKGFLDRFVKKPINRLEKKIKSFLYLLNNYSEIESIANLTQQSKHS